MKAHVARLTRRYPQRFRLYRPQIFLGGLNQQRSSSITVLAVPTSLPRRLLEWCERRSESRRFSHAGLPAWDRREWPAKPVQGSRQERTAAKQRKPRRTSADLLRSHRRGESITLALILRLRRCRSSVRLRLGRDL